MLIDFSQKLTHPVRATLGTSHGNLHPNYKILQKRLILLRGEFPVTHPASKPRGHPIDIHSSPHYTWEGVPAQSKGMKTLLIYPKIFGPPTSDALGKGWIDQMPESCPFDVG
jgi:hypothetical protein